jgi:hypothetical protein
MLDRTNVGDVVDDFLIVLVIEAVALEIVLFLMELLAGVTDANSCANDAHDLAQEMP